MFVVISKLGSVKESLSSLRELRCAVDENFFHQKCFVKILLIIEYSYLSHRNHSQKVEADSPDYRGARDK